ncbi:hypothetical protein N0V83_009504 [Neocucurbitaria cava]|uniref:Heterokaryon incompatibility domain-containing protein n=1 Tax=Neocucurbitaria cava TaxID=798079 RepID=A0A9W8Y1I6_9PLEO|nr:hypothetical protein N0V83_009504 [Neocucurbitaria cava]
MASFVDDPPGTDAILRLGDAWQYDPEDPTDYAQERKKREAEQTEVSDRAAQTCSGNFYELSKSPEFDEYIAPRAVVRDDVLFPMNPDVATQVQEMRESSNIDDVLKRLWFTRLWVVQEVILAKDIRLCIGSDFIPWHQFRRAVLMLWTANCQFVSTSLESDMNDPLVFALFLTDMREKMRCMENCNMLMRDYTRQVFGKTLDLSRSVPHRYWIPTSFEAAMNRVPAAVLHKSCHHLLAVKGCVFDTISQPLPTHITRETKTGVMDFIEAMKYLRFIYVFTKEHYEKRGGYVTGEDFDSIFNNVVTAGRTSGKLKRVAEGRNPDWID